MTAPDEPTIRLSPSGKEPASPPQTQPHRVTKTFRNLARPAPQSARPAPPSSPRPPARRRRLKGRKARVTPPTQEELDALPVEKRQELYDAHRQRPWQHLTSVGVLISLIFTGGGLVYTAQTWETGQETLKTTQQQQITDRYTKATEQLGSQMLDVRVGGIYALERIARDSPRDQPAIRDVLATFVRAHDPEPKVHPSPTPKVDDERQPELADDLQAALTVLGRRNTNVEPVSSINPGTGLPEEYLLDLRGVHAEGARLRGAALANSYLDEVDFKDADLTGADLSRSWLLRAQIPEATLSEARLSDAYLQQANLSRSDILRADLSRADLNSADLTRAWLTRSNLTGADLSLAKLDGAYLGRANFSDADLSVAELAGATLYLSTFSGANLSTATLRRASTCQLDEPQNCSADLRRANLKNALLSGAILRGANLSGADLTSADLTGADLTGADLTGIKGMTADEIRSQAKTDHTTKF